MLTSRFEKLNVTSSLLGFGCMRFPKEKGKDTADPALTKAMIHRAMEAGVNYYDTAYAYGGGNSERTLAAALDGYPRESYFLANKLPIWMLKKEADMERIFQESLDRCRTDYFDFYLAHSLDRETIPILGKLDVPGFLERKRREGKVRYVGFSFHDTPEYLRTMLEMHPWDFCQLQINYADWTLDNAKELYELTVEYDVPCIIMEPVRGGFLAAPPEAAAQVLRQGDGDRSPASWALRFAASLPNVRVVLSGMSTPEQVEDNLRTFSQPDIRLSPQEEEMVLAAGEALRGREGIPCTGCRYCGGCPQGIDIPGIFTDYNKVVVFGDKEGNYARDYREHILAQRRGADQCVECGACTAACPQGLKIPTLLQKAHETLIKK